MLKEGDPAPAIRLRTDSGEEFTLSGLRGKRVALYFYPRADTPGCTTEACEFRDGAESFAKKGAVVVGVSPDTPAAQAYGVWKEKNLYGRKSMGIERTTFIIGPDGKIEKIYAKVKAQGHAAKVLENL